ncbi:hypothetical protein NEUTE1DRAFT_117885 [Neurospora tetrasperma FGSC 2508]|uniref:Uncharacterized protein n=1 Tax=Neurospora tetrasperma (strain FGSC 2508 / ATCC MYA-4615 / P0657) TaxID=510951 RepID=F8MUQ1_NEUT8|nr:uncharacterized protein NEUTE1DRAFT_117885 [Neurospora tetrasperma FGSC 2508]EGO55733.1 hypothetical protein NEUTE1DRAFT_117885 [Neurospora tetrasperma FGSC 2508]EGZ69015.1 hypothetical protein NEUTE2DRAFT_145407 [Neurospora tetrasperma FGSC 2509]
MASITSTSTIPASTPLDLIALSIHSCLGGKCCCCYAPGHRAICIPALSSSLLSTLSAQIIAGAVREEDRLAAPRIANGENWGEMDTSPGAVTLSSAHCAVFVVIDGRARLD